LFFDWHETPVVFDFFDQSKIENPKSKIPFGGVLDSTLGWIMVLPFEDEGWPR